MMASSHRSHLPPPPPPSSSSLPFSSSSLLAAAAAVPQQQQQLDLDLTIVSAKHLKNVNWRNGELKPYAVFWLDPDRKLATKPDDCGSTRPVWNERFTLPVVSSSLDDSVLNLEIFHSKPSETPKPLVASLRCPLGDLLHPLLLLDEDHHHHHTNQHNHHHHHQQQRIRTLELHRPSGRPQGKIRLKVSLRERPPPPPPPPPHDYPSSPHTPPVPSAYYYSTAPPPPPPSSSSSSRDYHHRGVGGGFSPSPYGNLLPPHHPSHYSYASYADPYPGYYTGYYSPSLPPPPPRPFFDRSSGYGGPGGPSAPVDFSVPPQAASSSYEQKPKGSMMGFGTGVAVGALAGAMGGLALEEGLKYEEDKITERVERDLASRDDYSDYRAEY
ncbi:hypothetical protein MRB53_025186 [Persea americana]|uniref:Uncharacterized protein n=1 Tax=Persea americana TaxID=3435 RepID=A0ACC2LF92_PERAE|nr:hypothetical protein MRB53_025186 [Persea americana]